MVPWCTGKLQQFHQFLTLKTAMGIAFKACLSFRSLLQKIARTPDPDPDTS